MTVTDESAPTGDTFPRQSARTRRFTLGAPRDLRVVRGGARVLFLRSSDGSDPVNRLWVLDRGGEPRVVIDPVTALDALDDAALPAAERARRERARELGGGVVGYDVGADGTRVVCALGGRIVLADIDGGTARELPSTGDAFDPRLDPTGRRVAYVSGRTLRVTGDDGDRLVVGPDATDPDTVSWGAAEFVAAEEMGRTAGYWWAPDGESLLVERVDVAPVATWWIAAPVSPWVEPTAVRYPAAGTDNAMVSLWLVGIDGSRHAVAAPDGFEYLAGASWAPRSRPSAWWQTRDQRTVAVVEVDPGSGAIDEKRRMSDGAWVDLVPGAPAWSGDALVTVEVDGDTHRLCIDGTPLSPEGLQVRRIVDADDERVVVLASHDPTELHGWAIPVDGSAPQRITEAAGVHGVAVGGATTVVSSQVLERPGTAVTVRFGEAEPVRIESFAEAPLVRPRVTIEEVGERGLRCALLMPSDHDGSTRLPVLLDPYGGPGHARVLRSQAGFATSQWFADQGFAVLVVDGRGTPGRGPRWDRAIRGDVAGPVLDDQVEALLDIADGHPHLDMTRVGIRGWSFGGYLAALAVLRRPDVFHAAVAGAPVTDWRLYDTHYTERYLGHPGIDDSGYRRSDLVALAPQLERPLLLIHGLADDNVVMAHTLALSRALLEHGRPHRVLPLSGITHMASQESVAENLLMLEVQFFREALRIDGPVPAYQWKAMLPRRHSPL